jgi:hypothetical protein
VQKGAQAGFSFFSFFEFFSGFGFATYKKGKGMVTVTSSLSFLVREKQGSIQDPPLTALQGPCRQPEFLGESLQAL